MKAISS